MPTDEKPSRNEDEYFAKESAEQIKTHRAKLDEHRSKQERESHFMKCPRCGHDLHEERHHEVIVDRCKSCGGVWLDAGELSQLERIGSEKRSSFLGNVFGRGR